MYASLLHSRDAFINLVNSSYQIGPLIHKSLKPANHPLLTIEIGSHMLSKLVVVRCIFR
jgi:hypothetical protein